MNKCNTCPISVASDIISNIENISYLRMQRLMFYCQAWSMVWMGKPLFSGPIISSPAGPVIPLIQLCKEKDGFTVSEFPPENTKLKKLNKSETELIDAVLDFYGDKNLQYLGDLIRMEGMWTHDHSEDCKNKDVSEYHEISHEAMKDYYSSIIDNVHQ